jgi:ribonuclease P protein subunit RPR2
MAKGSANQTRSVPNKHLHARIAYLHQAATHLALQPQLVTHTDSSHLQQHGLPLLLAAQLQAVSQKAQIRLSHDMKRSICKVCSTPLMPDTTSETRIENKSRAEKKSCADVLVIRCRNCHTEKRFPIGAQRQKKKAERRGAASAVASTKSAKKQPAEVEMANA